MKDPQLIAYVAPPLTVTCAFVLTVNRLVVTGTPESDSYVIREESAKTMLICLPKGGVMHRFRTNMSPPRTPHGRAATLLVQSPVLDERT